MVELIPNNNCYLNNQICNNDLLWTYKVIKSFEAFLFWPKIEKVFPNSLSHSKFVIALFLGPRHHTNPKPVSIEPCDLRVSLKKSFALKRTSGQITTKCYTTNAFLWQMFILNKAALLEAIKVLYFSVHRTGLLSSQQ